MPIRLLIGGVPITFSRERGARLRLIGKSTIMSSVTLKRLTFTSRTSIHIQFIYKRCPVQLAGTMKGRSTDDSPHLQTRPIVKSPQFKLAPNTNSPHVLCMVSTVRAWFVLVVFYHRSNVYPALQVMVLVNKRRDRSMLCGMTDDSPHLQTRPKYTNLPHCKVATSMQTCPKNILAPLFRVMHYE